MIAKTESIVSRYKIGPYTMLAIYSSLGNMNKLKVVLIQQYGKTKFLWYIQLHKPIIASK